MANTPKLTPAIYAQIVDAIDAAPTIEVLAPGVLDQIAKEAGVSRSYVSQIARSHRMVAQTAPAGA